MKKVQLIFVSVFLLAVLSSCDNKNSGFDVADNGLRYQFHVENAENPQAKKGEFVELSLTYRTSTDSVLMSTSEMGQPFRILLGEASHKGGAIADALVMLHKGDSATFLISADSFFMHEAKAPLPDYIESGSDLTFDIKLVKIQTKEQLDEEMRLANKGKIENEKNLLNEYLKTNSISVEPTESGLYVVFEKHGKGKKAEVGDSVYVHYTGKFLNGEKFDSSVDRNESFRIKLGENRVIRAWEEGILQMREGDKILLISPSNLAYGDRGYPPVIPEFSSLVFEVELLKVIK